MTTGSRLALKPGLRVLVTAGASGIGRVIAATLSDGGAKVHVCDVDAAALEECRRSAPGIGASMADVSDEGQVESLFKTVADTLGGLDALVNNAGIAGPTGPIETMDPAEWRRTIAINLDGQFYCARLAVPMLKAAGNGAIINISSVAGRLGYAFRTPYAATKWAIVGLTESLAKELGPFGIRVNAILPGIVEGPRITRVIQARAETMGLDYAEMEKQYLDRVSLRRMVTPQDVADMALFLCTPAGGNISGQALSVCGNVEAI